MSQQRISTAFYDQYFTIGRITCSPTRVRVGDTLIIWGYLRRLDNNQGLPNQPINISSSPSLFAVQTTTITSGGFFSVAVNIPSTAAPGDYTITAEFPGAVVPEGYLEPCIGRGTIFVENTAIYDQYPGGTPGLIKCSPTRLGPGNTLTISGYLIRLDNNQGVPNQPITISSSPSLFAVQTTTTANGFFSISVNIPSNAALGEYMITARFDGAQVPEGYLAPCIGQEPILVKITTIYDRYPGGTPETIILSATRLKPGDTLTISGYLIRLDRNEGVPNQTINITTSPSLFSTQTTTTANGFFSASINIPSTMDAGEYTITAYFPGADVPEGSLESCVAYGTIFVETMAIYDVFPGGTAGTISLSATIVRPGDTLIISGYLVRLDRNEGVPNQTIYIDAWPDLFDVQTTTTANGFFSINVDIPDTAAPDTYEVSAYFPGAEVPEGRLASCLGTGTITVLAVVDTAIFDQYPGGTAGRISLSAARARPGDTLTISGYLVRLDTGEGVPNQPINISTSPLLFDTVQTTTTANGFFSANVNIPSNAAPGSYTIIADFPGAILP